MTNSAPELAENAAATLDSAFARRDEFRIGSERPRVGVFGNGMPETLIAAAGALPVHLSMGISRGNSAIDTIIEPFVDEEVRTFLNRLMNGDFAGYSGIVFARDDAPALIAYQYATEWVRQGKANESVPPFFLWNLVHTGTPAVQRFNAVQGEKLFDFLEKIGLSRPTPQSIAEAAKAEANRHAALDRMQALVGTEVTGTAAMRWRNAGRFMAASDHAQFLAAACPGEGEVAPDGIRIGIVGSPLACTTTYETLETFGVIVCDMQPWGSVWPGPGNAGPNLEDILRATASDASCPRITPPSANRASMVAALADARCDLVVCQLAQTDDTFGWEIPALAADLAAKGIAFLNLGFRDPEPDEIWRRNASRLIAAALEANQ